MFRYKSFKLESKSNTLLYLIVHKLLVLTQKRDTFYPKQHLVVLSVQFSCSNLLNRRGTLFDSVAGYHNLGSVNKDLFQQFVQGTLLYTILLLRSIIKLHRKNRFQARHSLELFKIFVMLLRTDFWYCSSISTNTCSKPTIRTK